MKTTFKITITLSILFLFGCGSDELSNSKAERILEKCLESEPMQRTVSVRLNGTYLQEKELEKYKELEEKGLIKIEQAKPKGSRPIKPTGNNDPLAQWRYEAELNRYNRQFKGKMDVEITKKGQKFIDEALENAGSVKMKSHNYKVDKVLEVQEIPSLNTATVKVQFKAIDITPFSVLQHKDPSEFLVQDVTMAKTSNGWKYCDNF